MSAFSVGLLLSVFYIAYLAIRCFLQEDLAPPMPPEEQRVPLSTKMKMVSTSILPPVVLILAVLGSIFGGVASPTEAAGVGSLAAMILAAAYRRFNWNTLKDSVLLTMRTTSMVVLIGLGAIVFTGVFDRAGGVDVVSAAIIAAPFGKWGAFAVIMFIIFILGMFVDWIGIIFLMVPLVTPIGQALGFDPLWFAMMIILNLQASFITPPFAYAIFFLRGIAEPEWGLTSGCIIRGVLPYVGLIGLSLVLCIIFPQIILWLPSLMIK